MKKKNDGLKWSADKKRERDLADEQRRAKEIIGAKYEAWKVELCSQSRTRKEVIAFFYKLRDMVLDHAKDCAELKLKDFSDFTYTIIERHLTALITAHITGHNVVKQHVPVSLVASGQVALAKTEAFRNREELMKVDFVQWFTKLPGFTGFSWQREECPLDIQFFLLAHYESGDSWLVGTLINDVGLDDIARYEDLKETIMLPVDFVKLRQTGRTGETGESLPPTAGATPAGEPPSATGDSGATGDTSSTTQ